MWQTRRKEVFGARKSEREILKPFIFLMSVVNVPRLRITAASNRRRIYSILRQFIFFFMSVVNVLRRGVSNRFRIYSILR